MTAKEKLALVKALRDARMPRTYPVQSQAWIDQQFNCCVNAILFITCATLDEMHQFRTLVDRDNFIAQDNPFRDT